MKFYSHSKQTETNETIGSKELKVHVNGVLEKAKSHLANNLNFDITFNELESLLVLIVKFHDLGKYTSFFQNYLLKKGKTDNDKKRHPPIGAFAAYNMHKDLNEKHALFSLYLIFLHHANLTDILQFSEKLNDYLKRIIDDQIEDLKKCSSIIESEIEINNFSEKIYYPEERTIRRSLKIWAKRNQNIQDYFLINYLFSLLIEADKLDASDTPIYKLKAFEADFVDNRFGRPKSNINELEPLTNSELRNYCRAEVISNLDSPDILNHYIFTLTAPTGIGKTMTALDFALKLKSKVRSDEGIESRIIYALPFINIIEQAFNEYQITLPEDIEILAHYQYSDVFGEEKKEEYKNEDGSIKNYNQKLMSLDTWQADVVITSFVQFFETLIGNRNKLLKKFNHFSNAIIIIDEVQTLRLDQMPLIGTTLYYLSKFLKSRIILMTATKPKIFDLTQKEILNYENEIVRPKELLSSHEHVFKAFNRTKIVNLINKKIDNTEDFINDIFSENWSKKKSCIIVCNTVNRSIEVYKAIKKYLKENDFQNPIEYLSTNIIPAHRFDRIEKVRKKIVGKAFPILISTQVVEAGVDLDFDMGFRDLGPIDSIIQVAGRINRNNNPVKKHSPLYIVDFGDSNKIYGSLTTIQASKTLKIKSEIPESEYLSFIESYFNTISDRSSFDQYNKVFQSMKSLCYDSENPEDHPVSSFKIIEESRTTKAVFIELTEFESKLRERYLAKIRNEISKEEFEKKYKKEFQQRIISIPGYLSNELSPINEYESNILVVPIELIGVYYNTSTGFVRKKQTNSTFFL